MIQTLTLTMPCPSFLAHHSSLIGPHTGVAISDDFKLRFNKSTNLVELLYLSFN